MATRGAKFSSSMRALLNAFVCSVRQRLQILSSAEGFLTRCRRILMNCCCPAVSVLSCSLSAVLRWVGWVGTFQGHHSYIARLWHHFPGYYYGTADSAVGENVNGTYGWEQSRHGSACSLLAFSWVDPLRNFHSSECHLPRTHTLTLTLARLAERILRVRVAECHTS